MQVTTRRRETVTILDVDGRLTIGLGDVALRKAVREQLQAGFNVLLLNLAGVTRLDSSGIGELVLSYTTVTDAGGRLALENLSAGVCAAAHATFLDDVFDIYEDEDEAIAALA